MVGRGDVQPSSSMANYTLLAYVHISTDSGERSGLSLLKLNQTVDGFGSDILAACLPQNGSLVKPGTYVDIFGWAPTAQKG